MLFDAFITQAQIRPAAIATEYNGAAVSYGQLLRQSSAFARWLHEQGIGANDRVAFALPKSNQAVVCVLGTMMAGAAYVPFDPRQPSQRMARALGDCDARAVISTPQLLGELRDVDATLLSGCRAVVSTGPSNVPRAIEYDFSKQSAEFLPTLPMDGHAPAYILYTSGSTGEPKGVVHSHDSACRFVDWAVRAFELGPAQALANFAHFSFDLSILDLFGALSTGARVHLVQPEMLLRPKELVHKLGEWQTTLLYAVPSAISLLESDGDLARHPPRGLERVLYAGEPFPIPHLQNAMRALPQARFFNLFGPTETNVCTFYCLPSVPPESAIEVPIGKPCDHLNVELLDESGRPTTPGEEGELCVSGPSVMTEYFRQPTLTQESTFSSSMFIDGLRRYRTGDRARLDESGLLWFRGRRDRLVKRRGYRIELGEIESAFTRSPGVQEAAVVSTMTDNGVRIHAFVVLRDGESASPLTLKVGCGRFLPPHMVPDAILVLPALPRTPNGKVDFMGLPEMPTV